MIYFLRGLGFWELPPKMFKNSARGGCPQPPGAGGLRQPPGAALGGWGAGGSPRGLEAWWLPMGAGDCPAV